MNARLIKTNGEVTEVKPKKGKYFSLEELQKYVGGYIEVVYLDSEIMIVNEDGKLIGLSVNDKATDMVKGDIIVGDVIVCPTNMLK